MAITRGTLRLARNLRRDIGTEVDNTARDLTAAWVKAWDGHVGMWRTAAADLVAEATRLDHWPRPTDIARLASVMTALDRAETLLGELADTTRQRAVDTANRVVTLDADREAALIASQAPETEREGLHRHLTRRVAEQTQIRSRVVSRIRTDAIDVIRQRAEGQITSDLLPLSTEATEAMRRELIRGVDVGDNPRRAAARMVNAVEGRFNGGLTRALVVSRTEILDAYRQTSQQIHQANQDIVPGWTWWAELDTKCCPSCWAMHGTNHPATDPGPDDHQQGRCARLPVLASWAQLGISAPEPPSVEVDAEAKFLSLSRDTQLAIMGARRLALLETGQVRWTDLATRRVNRNWRPSVVPTRVRDLERVASTAVTSTPLGNRIAAAMARGRATARERRQLLAALAAAVAAGIADPTADDLDPAAQALLRDLETR